VHCDAVCSGRTGRAGRSGTNVVLFDPKVDGWRSIMRLSDVRAVLVMAPSFLPSPVARPRVSLGIAVAVAGVCSHRLSPSSPSPPLDPRRSHCEWLVVLR
jgi:hypothetical protein